MDSAAAPRIGPNTVARHAPGDWVFDGGAPSLDFVNTLRGRATTPCETLYTEEDLTGWLVRAGLSARDAEPAPAPLLDQARALREAVDAVLLPESEVTGEQIGLLNRWARRAVVPQLDAGRPGVVVRLAESVEAALGAVAADAISLIAAGEGALIRVCAHTRCGLRYVDRSRGARRQWCSMRRCGNRAKVARHAANSTNRLGAPRRYSAPEPLE